MMLPRNQRDAADWRPTASRRLLFTFAVVVFGISSALWIVPRFFTFDGVYFWRDQESVLIRWVFPGDLILQRRGPLDPNYRTFPGYGDFEYPMTAPGLHLRTGPPAQGYNSYLNDKGSILGLWWEGSRAPPQSVTMVLVPLWMPTLLSVLLLWATSPRLRAILRHGSQGLRDVASLLFHRDAEQSGAAPKRSRVAMAVQRGMFLAAVATLMVVVTAWALTHMFRFTVMYVGSDQARVVAGWIYPGELTLALDGPLDPNYRQYTRRPFQSPPPGMQYQISAMPYGAKFPSPQDRPSTLGVWWGNDQSPPNSQNSAMIVVQFWMPALVSVILVGASSGSFRRVLRARMNRRRGLCPVCGYDLRSTPKLCPECGCAASDATMTDSETPRSRGDREASEDGGRSFDVGR